MAESHYYGMFNSITAGPFCYSGFNSLIFFCSNYILKVLPVGNDGFIKILTVFYIYFNKYCIIL